MRGNALRNRRLSLVAEVRCLDCGRAYAKPASGGTVRQNPGCPACGYIGWAPASADLMPAASRPSRSAAGPPLLRVGQAR